MARGQGVDVSVEDHGAVAGDGRDDTAAIQRAIDAAKPSDVVVFSAGRYDVSRDVRLANGVSLAGEPGAVISATSVRDRMVEFSNQSGERKGLQAPLRNVGIRDLAFENVRLTFKGEKKADLVRDIVVERCRFSKGFEVNTGVPRTHWAEFYVTVSWTQDATIRDSEFLREVNHGGRGVHIFASRGVTVTKSHFGVTRDGSIRAGHFRTAINVLGADKGDGCKGEACVVFAEDVKITDNVMVRGGTEPVCEKNECEDHGMYIRTFRNIVVSGNTVEGWTPTASGGALKMRQGEQAKVTNNVMRRSGVLLYTYEENFPHYLRKIEISDNRIDMLGVRCGDREHHRGILYMRTFGRPDDGERESEIVIRNNQFVNGGCIYVHRARAEALCASGNRVDVKASKLAGARLRPCAGASEPDTMVQAAESGTEEGSELDE